jgi:tetratricopeptide (TPR) repeat protein
VSSRARVYLSVALAATLAVAVVVGLTLDTRTDPQQPQPFKGKPPVPQGIPAPYASAIVTAFKDWPHGSISTMQQLGLTYPKSALVQYYRGVALIWAGYPDDAASALELAKKLGTNTIWQGRADDLLHPQYFEPTSGPPYPVFEPTSKNVLLERGSFLQQQGHQESAEQLYLEAAKRDPDDVEAQVAEAVGLFNESNLVPTFSHLGPLVKRFPTSQSVHYYLGFLLAWTHQESSAIQQFEETVKLGPSTALGRTSTRLLEAIAKSGGSATGT